MADKCVRLEAFMAEQMRVLRRHIDKHKWYNHISDLNKAVDDFNQKYGWVMRETFCDICPEEKTGCEAYKSYLKKNGINESTQGSP